MEFSMSFEKKFLARNKDDAFGVLEQDTALPTAIIGVVAFYVSQAAENRAIFVNVHGDTPCDECGSGPVDIHIFVEAMEVVAPAVELKATPAPAEKAPLAPAPEAGTDTLAGAEANDTPSASAGNDGPVDQDTLPAAEATDTLPGAAPAEALAPQPTQPTNV
jgi:hypothetical protein